VAIAELRQFWILFARLLENEAIKRYPIDEQSSSLFEKESKTPSLDFLPVSKYSLQILSNSIFFSNTELVGALIKVD